MNVTIDTASPVPVFEQLRAQVTTLVEEGALPAGTRLPSVRQLAEDLGIAPGTVARTYQRLEEAGVTTAHRRHGTRIADRLPIGDAERRRRLTQLAHEYVSATARLGIDVAVSKGIVMDAFDAASRSPS